MYVLCECVYKNETFVAAALRNEVAVEWSRAVSVSTSKNAWAVKSACASVYAGGDVGSNRWEARAERVTDAGWNMA